MFVFAARVMDEEVKAHLPELHRGIEDLVGAPDRLGEIYPQLPSISIDYGVMERSQQTMIMPAAFQWNDVGSWEAAYGVYSADDNENVVLGDAHVLDVRKSMVDARSGRFVALVGLDNVVVVDTEDAVLVMPRDRSQDVKKIVETLKKARRDTLI